MRSRPAPTSPRPTPRSGGKPDGGAAGAPGVRVSTAGAGVGDAGVSGATVAVGVAVGEGGAVGDDGAAVAVGAGVRVGWGVAGGRVAGGVAVGGTGVAVGAAGVSPGGRWRLGGGRDRRPGRDGLAVRRLSRRRPEVRPHSQPNNQQADQRKPEESLSHWLLLKRTVISRSRSSGIWNSKELSPATGGGLAESKVTPSPR
jgi:hypothetical protein